MTRSADIRKPLLYRALTLDRREINEEARTVPASLSSEIEIKRFFGTEKLVHSPEAVNLERAADGLPMLFGHDQDQPIGLVEDVRVEDGHLRGKLRFSKNRRATEVWEDVRDGFLKNISIGYRIDKWEETDDSDLVRITRWSLYEASVVSVPADPSVGINRSESEELTMANDTPNTPTPAPPEGGAPATRSEGGDGAVNVIAFREAREQAKREGRAEMQKELLKRIGHINDLFAPFLNRGPTFVNLRDELVRRGVTYEQARDALYDLFAGEPEPLGADVRQVEGSANSEDEQVTTYRSPQGRRQERITGGKDALEKFREGVTECLSIRAAQTIANHKIDPERVEKARKGNDFLGMTPVEMAREYLRIIGQPVAGLTRSQVVGMALSVRGLISHSTSDFANILEDVSNKSLQIGYNEAPETWGMWARTGSLPDFRQGNRPTLSAFGDLDIIYENGEYTYGTFQDLKEVLTLATYGKLFSISRQALINDDLDALGRIPASMGRAASRTVGDLAYNVLINGTTATLNQDATALFHANHGNLVPGGSGAAPSVATVNAARTAMATQTDPSGSAVLNIRPRFMMVPYALEGTARTIAMAEYDPAGTAGTLTPNTVRNTFEVIADARLDVADAAAWYMAADSSMVETVEVAFLEGNQAPYMEVQNGWSTDGASYKVRIDAVAAPLDFRGLYKNDGN